jgi:RNA polymerase primary sigma factor
MSEAMSRLRKVVRSLSENTGRKPTLDEIAKAAGLTREKIEQILTADKKLVSLDAPISADTDASIGDFIKDDQHPQPEEVAGDQLLAERIRGALETLTPNQRLVVTLRFGLGSRMPATLAEIGEILGISRERVRQIEMKALRTLRKNGQLSASITDLD